MATPRQCAAPDCKVVIQKHEHRNKRYCSNQCRDREAKRRYRARNSVKMIDERRIMRGDAYETLAKNPDLVEALAEGRITQAAAAAAISIGRSEFSRVYATFLMDRNLETKRAGWEMDPEIAGELMIGAWDAPCSCACDELDIWLDDAVDAFVRFRTRWFSTPRGPYITKAFHRLWIRGILKALITGGRYMILSPPRHGKSELLTQFATWLIARNPDIRILWIGGNSDIAGDMVGVVKQYLEDREDLRAAILGPGGSWAPSGRNKTAWGTTKLTVMNRTVISKAPTLRAVGRGGKILSMDVDLIICDDIEDYDSTLNESARTQTRNWWFNTVESRKEEHTAWVTIGSRQHPDDLYDYLLGDDEWETQVDSAHDVMCTREPMLIEVHDECMLFPELRSYRWLWSKRKSAESQGLLSNFEMVYLNDPRPPGLTVFSEEAIDACKNHERGLGLTGLPSTGYHLVAGIDPSATGFQAGFMWAWSREENRQYAVAVSNVKGGGVYQALELMSEWTEAYGCRHYVIEENGFQKAIRENRDVQAWAQANDVYLEPHQTQGGNKHDPMYGVGAMSNLYEMRMVDLPWGDEVARETMLPLVRQMLRFTDAADRLKRSTRKTDVLMASWFPMKVIRRLRKELEAGEIVMNDDASYAGFGSTDWNEAPW